MNEFPSFDQVLDAQNISIQLQVQHWLKYELYTPQACLLLAMLILPWFVWWKLVDKKRFLEIIIFGLLICTTATFLDEIGCQLNWWEYRYDIEPFFPRLIPMNFTMLPIGYMLIYQYFTKWKSFITANIISSALLAFIGESAAVSTGIYVLLKWKHLYSFPIYLLIGIVFKVVLNSIIEVHRRANQL